MIGKTQDKIKNLIRAQMQPLIDARILQINRHSNVTELRNALRVAEGDAAKIDELIETETQATIELIQFANLPLRYSDSNPRAQEVLQWHPDHNQRNECSAILFGLLGKMKAEQEKNEPLST